ncbi:uncharacterized protein A1O9_01508 [Exophiala aquamarina CBS 119918]|uniref:HMA domain-containing protein n=1 Tax=Exophiala aquamarina CBS 119918 TaxID=1182545 RepID=A0A072Q6H7_9EURO|nr:uncharacterized protein A1O9_01508 [Exophiala aquamarina CBS 119918]KEF63530.1 hypothetical protein A1O9_01508 [Exophiala aquamarina CBS 119918]
MACCVFTAYVMNRIIKACELFDVKLLDIQYNEFDDGFISWEAPENASRFISTRLTITGMFCGACAGTIEKALSDLEGVDRATVSSSLERATVVHDVLKVSAKSLVATIEDIGYGAALGERSAEQNLQLLQRTEELCSLRSSFQGAATLSSAIAGIEQLRAFSSKTPWGRHGNGILQLIALSLALWVQVFDSRWIHRSAWTRGRHGTFTMDTLISLSLLLGMSLSMFNLTLRGLERGQTYFTSGSFLATIITAGRYLDTLLKKKNVTNFTALYKMQAEAALVKVRKDGAYVPAALLRLQQEIVIEQSSIIPCDCYVIEGTSTVDESIMTGEAVPTRKTTGDFLLAGTRNLSHSLVAIVYKEQRDSTLDQLIDSISMATEHKMDGQEGVEAITTYFVLGILMLTTLGFFRAFSSSQQHITLALVDRINLASERAMAILAAACPCALGLATPSAIMAGIDAAWSKGVLFLNGARTIENLSKLSHIVMDKTGTLTEGRLAITSADFASQFTSRKHLCYRLLCAAEREEAQNHPVGKVVFQWALTQLEDEDRRLQSSVPVRKLNSTPGKGISCEVEGPYTAWHEVHIGNASFLLENNISIPPPSHKSPPTLESGTAVYFAINNLFAGKLQLQDIIRPNAPAVISNLRSLGLSLSMLTGDTESEAQRVSCQLSIPVLASKSLPADKHTHILALQSKGAVVAMLGDGINDAPAQAAADVGILLSLSRSAIAGAADVIVMSPDLTCVPNIIEIARITKSHAKRNVACAAMYNIVAVGLAMGVAERWGVSIDASTAGTMMALSSLGLLASSLWLRRRLQ